MMGREAVVTGLTAQRTAIAVGGLLVLLLIEQWAPFRRPVERYWPRLVRNLAIAGGNTLMLSVLLGGLLLSAYQALELRRVGVLHAFGVEGWINIFASVVLLDGFTYAWHRAYHRVPLMWRLHRAHHSDLDLDVTSAGRFHLFEMALSALVRLGVIAAIGADASSVVIFEIVFGVANQLEHANLRVPPRLDAWLQWVFVTPDMHRIHHSQRPEHTNSNYSTIFSWWDRLCGSYRVIDDQQTLLIGLPEYPRPGDVILPRVLAMPFGPPCASS